MSTECPFCDLSGVAEDSIAYEDEHTAAFFPTHPAAVGHTLVVPRRHLPDLFALDRDTAGQVMDTTLRVAAALRAAFGAPGLNLINSSGAAASQTVDHLHVHLVPRWEKDRMGALWPEPEAPDPAAERDRLVRLRDEIQRRG